MTTPTVRRICGLLTLDLGTKVLAHALLPAYVEGIGHWVFFRVTMNNQGPLGLAQPPWVSVLSSIGVLGLMWWIWSHECRRERMFSAYLMAGILGNGVQLVTQQSVTDWIGVQVGDLILIGNLADVFICVGIVGLCRFLGGSRRAAPAVPDGS